MNIYKVSKFSLEYFVILFCFQVNRTLLAPTCCVIYFHFNCNLGSLYTTWCSDWKLNWKILVLLHYKTFTKNLWILTSTAFGTIALKPCNIPLLEIETCWKIEEKVRRFEYHVFFWMFAFMFHVWMKNKSTNWNQLCTFLMSFYHRQWNTIYCYTSQQWFLIVSTSGQSIAEASPFVDQLLEAWYRGESTH